MDLMELLLIALAVGLSILLFVAIALEWFPKNESGIASLTAMHDFQPLDKQHATETVIEQKAGKKWAEQDTGDTGRKEGTDRTDPTAPAKGADRSGGAPRAERKSNI